MSETPSRFDRLDALLVAPIALGFAGLVLIDRLVLPRVRSDVTLGIANTTERLPTSVMLLYAKHAALGATAAALILLLVGLLLRVLLWRRLGRAALLLGCLVAPLCFAVVSRGAARATEIAFGPGLSVCRCPPGFAIGLSLTEVRCGCDRDGRVRTELVPKSHTAYDGDLRVRYEYDADGRRVTGFSLEVLGPEPHPNRVCSYDPPSEPDQLEARTPRCKSLAAEPNSALEPSPRNDARTAASADPGPITLASGHALRHGVARLEDRQLVVRMTDEPGPCGLSLDAKYTAALSLEIPPGPGGRFFVGAPAGVRAFGRAGGERIEIAPSEAIVTLQPFDLVKGARVRGRLDLPRGAGSFEAEICALDSSAPALPAEAPDEPAAGSLDGRPFRAKRSLIYLEGGEPARLERLRLSQDDRATCIDFRSTEASPSLLLTGLGGAGSRRPLLRTPQPAWAAAVSLPLVRSHRLGRMPAWLRFDHLAFEPGGRVSGVLVVEQQTKGEQTTRVAGRFEAEVCAR